MATTYPWNGTRATREVIIENHEPAVKRRDLEAMGKHISCQLKALRMAQKEQFKCGTKIARCNERKLMRKMRQLELLEIIRRRGGHHGRRDELLELILVGGEGGLGGAGDDNAALLALLLEDDRRGGHREHGRHEDIEMMMLNNRINKLSNNVTQLDTLLGVRPINPATTTA